MFEEHLLGVSHCPGAAHVRPPRERRNKEAKAARPGPTPAREERL